MSDTPRVVGRARRQVVAMVALFAAAAAPVARAEEWHEAYRAGLDAQARGDHPRAVEAFRRAIRAHPEPGRNLVTYGTNLEPRYFPYLRLAESSLALGNLDEAREALQSSSQWKKEPAEERDRLAARLAAAEEQRRPPPAPSAATPAPSGAAAVPSAAPSPTPMPTPPGIAAEPPPPTAAAPTLAPAPPSAKAGPPRTERAAVSSPPTTAPALPSSPLPASTPDPATGTLEVVSEPAGAQCYVDDEMVGSTDPSTGRLVKSGLRAGPRRVRVSHPGHDDLVREIDVPPGGRAAFHAVLSSAEKRGALPIGVTVFALLATVAIGAWAWRAWRRPEGRPSSIWAVTPVMPRSGPGSGGRGTPPGQINPGVRQDEEGREWFGDYRLLGLLGRGGMASVWKAELRNEISALKRPLGSFLEDRLFLDRFLREAEIGRTLNHPNIVRILDRGLVETVPYFTMEFLAGQTLQSLLHDQGALPARDATAVVVQIAEALDFAHSKGVIHRDLKPSNVMQLRDGTVKVMDFGIARALRFDDLTASGAFLGTPDYVAPEMIEGLGTEPRSDLYTLGVVFYEALTGKRPFGGDAPFAILRKHCTEEPVPPSRIAPGIPPELEAIVLRLMRKRPDDRPASAETLVVMLRDWLHRAA